MLATGTLLAQLRPDNTTPVTAFTASSLTEVSLIIVHNNNGSAQGFSLYHDDDGTTYDLTTALYVAKSVAANDTLRLESQSIGAGIMVSSGGTLGVATALADALTISIYGVVTRVTGYGGNL